MYVEYIKNSHNSKIKRQIIQLKWAKEDNRVAQRNRAGPIKWEKDLNKHVSKDIQKANKYVKRFLTSLVVREMHRRYHFIPTRMFTIKKIGNNKHGKSTEKLGPHTMLTGM